MNKLRRIKHIKEMLNRSNQIEESKETLLMQQLSQELKELNIPEENLEEALAKCRRTIKVYAVAKKTYDETEPYRKMESKLTKARNLKLEI